MTDQERQDAERLLEAFGSDPFTSLEACDVLGIEWREFMDRHVALSENSGPVQRAGTRGDESLYAVVPEEDRR